MMRASTIGSAALISLIAGSSAAQTTMVDVPAAKAMYREALLGYCAEQVTGRALIPHALNPASDEWVAMRPDPQTTGGLSLFGGRVNRQTSVIIDLSPTATSCFVQVNLPGGGGALVRDALADELEGAFGGAKLQDFPASEAGSGALYGIVSEDSDAVPLFALNRDQSGDVATGVVQIGQRQAP